MKKTITPFLMIASLSLMATSVYAETQEPRTETPPPAQQFLGQRAYAQPVQVARDDAGQAWVGATLVVDQPAAQKITPQKLHMLGKRGF